MKVISGIDAAWLVPELASIPGVAGSRGPVLVWRFAQPVRSISSAIVGGGIGLCNWVLNVTVDPLYSRLDPAVHIAEVAESLGLVGPGIGLLTAVDVGTHRVHSVGGTTVVGTVGVSMPVWAFDPGEPLLPHRSDGTNVPGPTPPPPGTINLVCFVEQRLSDAALVNAVTTISEAKAQAMYARGAPGTGTASDAVCVLCPTGGIEEIFGGPRSYWGARLASASYEAVVSGIDRQRHANGMRS